MISRKKHLILPFLLLAAGACAGGGGAPSSTMPGGTTLAGGERPRQTENTRTAQRLLDRAEDTEEGTESQALYQQAYDAAELAIAEDETNPLGHRQAALAAVGLEQYLVAGDHFDRAGELWPIYDLEDQAFRENLWITLYNEAAPYLNQADYEGAAEVFEQAHAIYKLRPEVMITLAQIYGQLGQIDLALERISEAEAFLVADAFAEADSAMQADWQGQVAELPMLRANVLAQGNRLDEAVDAYRVLVAADPDNVRAALDLGGLMVETGRTEEAFELFHELMSSGAELGALDYYRMGVGFYNGEDNANAIVAFGRTVELSPYDRDALEMWTRTLAQDSAYAEVVEATDQWLELDPASGVALLLRASALNNLGMEEETSAAAAAMSAQAFDVTDLRLQRYSDGGARLSGSVENRLMEQGETVTLIFTFYGGDGSAVGEVDQTVTLSAPEQKQAFLFEFASEAQVAGYGYRVGG